jgi:flagellar basal-body rod modification protein FlgD
MTAPISSTMPHPGPTDNGSFTVGAAAGGSMGKDAFMKLLITQMTHQDPLNPQDGAQMATQLAQFSTLEQMVNINRTLQNQVDATATLSGAVGASSAVALLGKTVAATSDTILGGVAGTTVVGTTVPAGGGHLSVRVTDANGQTLQVKDLGVVGAGPVTADIGTLTRGLPSGTYKVAFDLTDATGAVTHPSSIVTAKVDGVRLGANGAVVTSGALSFPIGTIVSVQ